MVSRYSNELNSFRSGIEDRVAQHKDKLSAVNQALGIKADKVFENAKKISDIGTKLTEGGIGGGVGSTALAKYARKGITKFNTFKQAATDKLTEASDKVKGLADKAESGVQEAGSKAKDLTSDIESKAQDAAGNAESQVRQTAQNAQSTAEDAAQSARDSVVSETKTEGASNQSVGGNETTVEPRQLSGEEGGAFDESNPTAQAQELDTNIDKLRNGGLGGEGRPAQARSYPNQETEGETNGESLVDEPTPSSGAGGGGDAPSVSTTSTVEEATTESGLIGGAEDLEDAAAATSWLGFLGIPEILAGLGAVAGVAAAGVGIADAVKSGDVNAKAGAMATQAPKTGFQAAGTFVVPTQDSVS